MARRPRRVTLSGAKCYNKALRKRQAVTAHAPAFLFHEDST